MVRSSSIWLLPQILAFDTALVALSWQLLFARTFNVPIRIPTLVITATAVWMIYVADHFLDARTLTAGGQTPLSIRHRHVWKHRHAYLGVFIPLSALSIGLVFVIPARIIFSGSCLAMVVVLYAVIVHHSSRRVRRAWPKELVIGIVFAAGSTVATWCSPNHWKEVLPALALFAALCVLNCAALEFHERQQHVDRTTSPHPSTAWLGRHFTVLIVILLAGDIALEHFTHQLRLSLAIGLAAALQFLVLKLGRNWRADAVRAVADASLLTPLLVLWIRA